MTRPSPLAVISALFVLIVVVPGCGRLFIRDIASDVLDPSNLADTEPSIAVNPRNTREISVVAFSENWNATKGAPVWRSEDRGQTWRKVFVIGQPTADQAGPNDQKLDYDAQGRVHSAELALDGDTFDYVYRQTGPPNDALAPGASFGDDQPHLVVDRSPTSPFKDRLYAPWLDFSQSNPRSSVCWSADRGVTRTCVGVGSNASFPNRTTRIAVAPDGKVYVVYKTREGSVAGGFENAHLVVHRSDDGGVTWNALGTSGTSVHGAAQIQTYFTNDFGNPAQGKVARARSSDAWIATDPVRGHVYVAYVHRDGSGFAQIYVARSLDDGATWTSTRVSDGTHHSAYPEIAVTKRGIVGVLYVDYDDAGSATIFRHRFARTFDGAQTWPSDVILQNMDPAPLGNAASGFLWGDYEGLTSESNTFYGIFTGESSGRATPQLDPIFFRQKSCRWWSLSCWLDSE